jgi:metal-responsive CopG/Arc/MetJ family transcriptional regulator
MPAEESTARLTISLPASVVDDLDRFLARGTSRSAAVRAALEQAIDEARRREEVERYVRGYEAMPQTEEEFGWADAAALDLWAEHPPA